MKENNKDIVKWVKVIILALYCLLTIATCAGVWNFCKEPLVNWAAGILMAANCFIAYITFKWIRKD